MTQSPTNTMSINDQEGSFVMNARQITEAQIAAIAALPDFNTATTREAYLAWVVQWKSTYRDLSAAIRRLKPMRKESTDAFDSSADWTKSRLRRQATAMMVLRADAKAWGIERRDAHLKIEEVAA